MIDIILMFFGFNIEEQPVIPENIEFCKNIYWEGDVTAFLNADCDLEQTEERILRTKRSY